MKAHYMPAPNEWRTRLAVIGLVLPVWTGTARGADDQPANQLQTVIVTAQKRTQNIRDVPLNVTAISGADLEKRGVTDFVDLGRDVPGLAVTQGGSPAQENISMRGVASSTSDGTVGIFLDDVSVTSRTTYASGAAEPQFLDVERVEVLRGPQGTLYGASSMGGAIRFITNPPNPNQQEGSVRTQLTNTKGGGPGYEVTAVENVPVVPGRDALRFAVQSFYNGGYVDRVSPVDGAIFERNANTEQGIAGRIAILSQVGSNLTLTPSIFFQRSRSGDLSLINPNLPGLQKDTLIAESGTDQLVVSSLKVSYEMGLAALTSVTSYESRHLEQVLDGSALNSQYFGTVLLPQLGLTGAGAAAVAALPSPVQVPSKVGQFTQELRLSSNNRYKARGSISWVAGLYFSDNNYRLSDYETVHGLTQTLIDSYGVTPEALFDTPFPNDAVYSSYSKIDERQYAAFADVTYQATSKFRAEVGGRYNAAKISLNRAGNYFFAGGPSQDSSDAREHAFTPRAAVLYDVSKGVTVYANAAKGFRLGTPNRAVPLDLCGADLAAIGLTEAPRSSNSDSLWDYEAGIKSLLLNNRMSLNVTGFYIKWHGIQQDFILPTCGFDFNANAGDARSRGAELEWQFRPAAGLTLSLSGSSTNAEIVSDIGALGVQKGDKVLGVPEWSGAASVDYRAPISSRLKLLLGASYQYVGRSYGSFLTTDPNYRDPAYGVLSLTVGLESESLEVSLFGKNVLNDHKIIQQPDITGLPRGVIIQPRTIGVAAEYLF